MKKWLKNTLLTMGIIGASIGLSACSSDNKSKVQYRVEDGYIQSSTDGKEWKNILEVDEIRDTYSVTYDYGDAESYFDNIKENSTVKDNEWLADMPTIKDEYKNCFMGWFITGSDKKIAEYDFIGQDVTLEARFDISHPEIISGLYKNGKMMSTWQDLLLGNSVSVEDDSLTSVNIYWRGEVDLVIDKSITKIKNASFPKIFGGELHGVVFPENLTDIEGVNFVDCGLAQCRGIKRIIVNKNNRVYDSRDNCNAIIETATNKLILGISTTKISNSVTEIGPLAFVYNGENSGISSLYIPKSVTKINGNPFMSCLNLTNIFVEKGNPVYDSRDNCNAIIETSTNTLITGCNNTIIPNTIEKIGDFAFKDYRELKNIVLPESVEEIGGWAFDNCQGLEFIVIPKNVIIIGSSAFMGCIKLSTIFYEGNSTDKAQISMENVDAGVEGSIWCYYSDAQPSEDGNYWHYVDDVPTKW